MNFKSLEGFQSWLVQNCGVEKYTPGLERIKQFLGDWIHELNKKKIITITGTNGKGQTSQVINFLLNKNKNTEEQILYWSSPHLFRLTERIQLNGVDIDEHIFLNLAEEINQKKINSKINLTYYEFLFACFCLYSIRINANVLILEVGLGGRLDAVNVLNAQSVLLTSISRDHSEFLGNSYSMVLKEKLGVINSQTSIFYSSLELKFLQEKTQEYLESKNLRMKWVDLFATKIVNFNSDFHERNLKLASEFCGAILNIPSGDLFKMAKLHRDYRRLNFENKIEVFGSHNIDGMRKLIQFLRVQHYNNIELIILAFSQRPEREIESILKMFSLEFGQGAKLILTSFDHQKAYLPTRKMIENLAGKIEYQQDWKSYFHNSKTKGKVLFLGSYYFASNVGEYFHQQGLRRC